MKRNKFILIFTLCLISIISPVFNGFSMEMPQLVASQSNLENIPVAQKILANDDYIFVAARNVLVDKESSYSNATEIQIYDVNDVSTPLTTIYKWPFKDSGYGRQPIQNMILTEDKHLIVNFNATPSIGGGDRVISVYDVSEIASGQNMEETATSGKPANAAVMTEGSGYLFVSVRDNTSTTHADENCIHIYDINEFDNPDASGMAEPIARVDGFAPEGFWVSGGYLFTRNSDKTIVNIYKVSDLIESQSATSALVRENFSVAEGYPISSIVSNEKHLFISIDKYDVGGVYIYNLSDIEGEEELTYKALYRPGAQITTLLVNGNMLFVSAKGRKDVRIVDVSDVSNIQELYEIDVCKENAYGYDFCLNNNKLYVCDRTSGVNVYNLHKTNFIDVGVYKGNVNLGRLSNGNIRAQISVDNYFDKDKVSGKLVIAEYKDGRLGQMKIQDIDVMAGYGTKTISTEDICIENSDESYVKVFFLDGFDTLIPLTKALEVKNITTSIPKAFYVDSLTGNDENSGTESAPFKTIKRAQEEVRKYNRLMSSDMYVYLKGGTYYIDETLEFTDADNGFNGFNVIYQAAEGEKVSISGGIEIKNWELHDKEKNIFKAKAQGADNRHLFVNGKRAVRARSEGDVKDFVNDRKNDDDAVGFTCSNMEFLQYADITNVEFVFKENWYSRRSHPLEITKIDDDTVELTMRNWKSVNANESGMPKSVYYYENAYELLDEEGEFYVDKTKDIVYYRPVSGEDIHSSAIIAPKLETILQVRGSSVIRPANNIKFIGIEFKDTTWLSPNENDFLDSQNLYPEMPASAVYIENAHDIRMEKCIIKNCGGDGLATARTVQNCAFIGNKIYDISARGMHIGDWNGPEDSNNPLEIASGFTVKNNYIHSVGEEYYASPGLSGVWIADTEISHNEIFDVPYSGMHIGWGWNDHEKTSLKNLLIEHNYIHDVMHTCIDGGAIYFLGANRATVENMNVVRNNYFKNTGMGTMGVVYCDSGAVNYNISQNVMDNHESVWNGNYGITGEGNVYSGNYTTTDTFRASPLNSVVPTDTKVYPRANWPDEALQIVNNAGLQEEYRYLSDSSTQFKLKKNMAIDGVSMLMRANADYAFIKTSDTDVSVYGVSDLETITKIATISEQEEVNNGGYTVKSLELTEKHLIIHFSGTASDKIVAYDISAPEAGITKTDEISLNNNFVMLLNDHYLMAAYEQDRIEFYDIKNIDQNGFVLETTADFDCETEMYVDNEYLYVRRSNAIAVYDLEGTALSFKGACPITDAGVNSIVRHGEYIYVTTNLPTGDRNYIYSYHINNLRSDDADGSDMQPLESQAPVKNYEIVEELQKSRVVTQAQNDKYLFKIREDDGTCIDIYSVTNTAEKLTTIQYHMGYELANPYYTFGSLCLKDDRLVVVCNRTKGNGNPRVAVYDVSHVTSGATLEPLGSISIYRKDNGIVFKNDNYVFLNDQTLSTLYICTLDSKQSPILRVATLITDSNNMYADNNFLYVHNEEEGVIDIYSLAGISDGSFGPMHIIGSIPDDKQGLDEISQSSTYPATTLCRSESYLFSVNEDLGFINVLDISNPTKVKSAFTLPLYEDKTAAGVYVSGNRVYVLEENKRMLIYEKNK